MKILYLSIIFFGVACNETEQKAAGPAESVTETVFEKGEHLFKVNCIQCHMPAKDFAAPALAGVEKRWKDKNLLYDFVRNSQEVIKKDKYAADLFEKWKQAPMLPFPHLSNTDIDAIFEYCNSVAAP
ncbi:MAG: cytochrome c [Sphingobacteriales bacterium]|nr:MAG: cytochrome c [Sphingobacteriales bacterium]